MTISRPLRLSGTVSRRSEASNHLRSPSDVVLVERERPRLLLLFCPCGCREELPINLDPRAGLAWRFYSSGRNGLSLFPSVWRESGCRSHFIVWRGKTYLFQRAEDELNTSQQTQDSALDDEVRERLPGAGLVSFVELAEDLGVVPWDVLIVCHRLVRKGVAREGKSRQRGSFGRV